MKSLTKLPLIVAGLIIGAVAITVTKHNVQTAEAEDLERASMYCLTQYMSPEAVKRSNRLLGFLVFSKGEKYSMQYVHNFDNDQLAACILHQIGKDYLIQRKENLSPFPEMLKMSDY